MDTYEPTAGDRLLALIGAPLIALIMIGAPLLTVFLLQNATCNNPTLAPSFSYCKEYETKLGEKPKTNDNNNKRK